MGPGTTISSIDFSSRDASSPAFVIEMPWDRTRITI